MSKSSRLASLQSARSIKDIEKVIGKIASSINSSDSKMIVSLAADDIEVIESDELLDGKRSPRASNKPRVPRKSLDIAFNGDIKLPADVRTYNERLGFMKENLADLHSAMMLCKNKHFSHLKGAERVEKEIQALIKSANAYVARQKKSMSAAITNKPELEFHHKHVAFIRQHLDRVLPESQHTGIVAQSYLLTATTEDDDKQNREPYKGEPEDRVMIQSYIKVKDLANEQGYSYDSFIIVLTARQAEIKGKNGFEYFVTSIKTDRVPGSFSIGKRVKTTSDLVKHINAMLSINNFVGRVDRLPITKSSKQLKDLDIKKIANVKDVRVVQDTIMVQLRAGLQQNEIDKAVRDLRAFLQTAIKTDRKKSVIASKVHKGGKTGSVFVSFTLGSSMSHHEQKSQHNVKAANRLADVLQLTPRQKRELIESIT